MQSTAKNVTAYLDDVPVERKAALTKLRDLCCVSLKGFEESMKYGGPCYSRNAHRDLLKVKGVSVGKGVVRYSKPERIDFKESK